MKSQQRKDWWRKGRFGMFIHWGLYSLMGRGEWVMYRERIPVKEYEKLAADFNPARYNAEEWVKLAKKTGMKYIVITAKHHDGFSMFKTEVSPYNIVDATPYGREILTELAEACRREGLKLCFYYSHVREWRHPMAQSLEVQGVDWCGNFGNFWDYRDEWRKDLQTYIDEFDKPQLKELLTKYGPVGIMWFDTPSHIRPDQAAELIRLVRELQPECLVNSRVGDDEGLDFDYLSLADCEIPETAVGMDWETPMTICNDWGYNCLPGNKYRSPEEVIRQLVNIVSLGGNYLLNVGPDGDGVIPEEARACLDEVGRWMEVNGEAVYGTKGSPFADAPLQGRITAKGNRLFFHVFDWKETASLFGLKNRVKSCSLLSDSSHEIRFTQHMDSVLGYTRLKLDLPEPPPDPYCTVIVIECEGEPEAGGIIIQEDERPIRLSASRANIHKTAEDSRVKVSRSGALQDWFHTGDWLSWEYIATLPGEYEVKLSVATSQYGQEWDYGHEVKITVNGQNLLCRVEEEKAGGLEGKPQIIKAGRIRLEQAGRYEAVLRAESICWKNLKGLTFASLELVPV